MNRAAITSIRGNTPVELPDGKVVPAEYRIEQDGSIHLDFTDTTIAQRLIGLLMDSRGSRLLAMGFRYVPAANSDAFPREPLSTDDRFMDRLIEKGYNRTMILGFLETLDKAGFVVCEKDQVPYGSSS